MVRFLIKAGVYIIIFIIILSFLWQFLLNESFFDVLAGQ